MKRLDYYSLLGVVVPAIRREQRTLHWVGSGDWENPRNWSLDAYGTGGEQPPTRTDSVVFMNRHAGNCYVNGPVEINEITVESSYTGTVDFQQASLTLSGFALAPEFANSALG